MHDIRQAMKDAWRPTRCPRCDVPMVRDLSARRETYHCPNCATRWDPARSTLTLPTAHHVATLPSSLTGVTSANAACSRAGSSDIN